MRHGDVDALQVLGQHLSEEGEAVDVDLRGGFEAELLLQCLLCLLLGVHGGAAVAEDQQRAERGGADQQLEGAAGAPEGAFTLPFSLGAAVVGG
ncbi:hypothetical protein GCM10020000_34970 [Streptomyces olivoverticillatus]